MITHRTDVQLSVEALPAFRDNYLWLIHDGSSAVVVDPGDAAVVDAAVRQRGLHLRHALVTHHHADHIGGLAYLKKKHDIEIHGPEAEAERISLLNDRLNDGQLLALDSPRITFSVIAVPGHTRGHIAYYAKTPEPGMLFCGDTLFSAGCGRLFEGTASQMLTSLRRLAALPPATAVYCAHEYTLSNLLFAAEVDSENAKVRQALAEVRRMREKGVPTLPTTVSREREINPFLRCDVHTVSRTVSHHADLSNATDVEVFAAMRKWKDGFTVAAV